MLRKSAVFWLGLTALAGGFLFRTSYQVQEVEEELSSLNRKIVAEQEAIQVLKAEWGYFNEPGRLAELSKHYLTMQPTQTVQLANLSTIPLKPPSARRPQGGVVPASQPLAPTGQPTVQPTPVAALPVAARVAPPPVPTTTAPTTAIANAANAPTTVIAAAVLTPVKPSPTARVAVTGGSVIASAAAEPAVPAPEAAPAVDGGRLAGGPVPTRKPPPRRLPQRDDVGLLLARLGGN